MEAFVHQVASGLAAGGIYASLAVALVLIYRCTASVNFAQGELAMFSTYMTWALVQAGVSYWAAFAAVLVGSFLIGMAMDRVIFRVYLKNIIFDSSAIILAVFISNIFLTLRTYNTKPYMSFLGVVVNFGWMGSAVCMILEPVHLRRVFEKRARMYHVVPAFITALAIGAQIQVF